MTNPNLPAPAGAGPSSGEPVSHTSHRGGVHVGPATILCLLSHLLGFDIALSLGGSWLVYIMLAVMSIAVFITAMAIDDITPNQRGKG